MNEQEFIKRFEGYFGKEKERKDSVIPVLKPNQPQNKVYADEKSERIHLTESSYGRNYDTYFLTKTADDNMDDIDQLAFLLKKLCNAAWGDSWGELSLDLKKGENNSNIPMPQIVLDINTRDIAEGIGSPKPKLVDVIYELDGKEEKTGDAFLVYRQWFDCIVEFNIYGRTNEEARKIRKDLERLILTYTGYLKRNGISEIRFERETSPVCSLYYNEQTPMRTLYYYIRFENITPIRQSTINDINLKLGISKINSDKVKSLIDTSPLKDIIELDFFDGDNGITYIE